MPQRQMSKKKICHSFIWLSVCHCNAKLYVGELEAYLLCNTCFFLLPPAYSLHVICYNTTESRLSLNRGDGVSLFYGVFIPPPLLTSLFIYLRYKMKMNSAFDSALGSW